MIELFFDRNSCFLIFFYLTRKKIECGSTFVVLITELQRIRISSAIDADMPDLVSFMMYSVIFSQRNFIFDTLGILELFSMTEPRKPRVELTRRSR